MKGRAFGAPLLRACLYAAILLSAIGGAAWAAGADDLTDPPAPGPPPPGPSAPPRGDPPPVAANGPPAPGGDADDEPMPPAIPPAPAAKPAPATPPGTSSAPPATWASPAGPPPSSPSPSSSSTPTPKPVPAPPPAAPPSPGPFPWPTGPSSPSAVVAPAPPVRVEPAAATVGAPPAVAATAKPLPASLAQRTRIGFYGEGQLFIDAESNKTVRLPELVVSIDHHPNDWLRIVGALEADDLSRVALQQAFLEASPEPFIGLRAGLLIVPLGLGNLSPEPTSYLTVDRPLTDQLIVPAVWRELGVGIFGEIGPGLRYQGQVLSGLDGTGFAAQAPLWGGRGDGGSLAVHDAAVAGRLELVDLPPGLVVGGGGYYGNATDGLRTLSGLHVGVVEADARYKKSGFDLRAEYARLYIV
ncbi:MAG TPA: hypothetical protein VLA79_00740, partial [Polyangia bacterium]|nr:hypothetical protein [Polyangia bacterium]